MIFDELNYEKVLEAVTPVAEAMEKISSNSMKIALTGEDEDIPLITVVVSREDKAPLVSQAMDLLDKAYDLGRDGESLDGINDEMTEFLHNAIAAGRTAEENRPDIDDEDDEDYLCHDDLHFEDDDDYDDFDDEDEFNEED